MEKGLGGRLSLPSIQGESEEYILQVMKHTNERIHPEFEAKTDDTRSLTQGVSDYSTQ